MGPVAQFVAGILVAGMLVANWLFAYWLGTYGLEKVLVGNAVAGIPVAEPEFTTGAIGFMGAMGTPEFGIV